ncbi:MAG: hypothetical protein IJD91_09135 [Clostridia bacterium]|nr:hypothetical protein [Clostridia bacterium]MBQ7044464.1 hypothetical protein [Clostridia bacterium]
MVWNIIGIIVAIIYFAYNIMVAKFKSTKVMKRKYFDNHCVVGKVAASIFYAPAWILKGVRAVVLAVIA